MSKELEAFERIKNITYDRTDLYGIEVFREDLDIIETVLKNYQELIEKPYVIVTRTPGYTQAVIDTICKNYKEVKITNIEDENKLIAFETIKEKNVCISVLKDSSSVEEYNNVILYHRVCSMSFEKPIPLTQEEYDLLREALKNE